MAKNPPAVHETQVRSLGQEDAWRSGWHPTPVLLPGESHGRRSLAGYSPWGQEELVTPATNTHTHTRLIYSILVSGVQQGDSVTHTSTCLFFYRFFSIKRYYVKVLVAHWVWLFATPWAVAHQAPLSMGISKQEYWRVAVIPFSRESS